MRKIEFETAGIDLGFQVRLLLRAINELHLSWLNFQIGSKYGLQHGPRYGEPVPVFIKVEAVSAGKLIGSKQVAATLYYRCGLKQVDTPKMNLAWRQVIANGSIGRNHSAIILAEDMERRVRSYCCGTLILNLRVTDLPA